MQRAPQSPRTPRPAMVLPRPGSRLKGLYQHMAAGDKAEANAALALLAAAAARGPVVAAELLAAFEWGHKVFAKLARPAR